MTDGDFLAAFEGGTLPKDAFHHREHIRLAWLCLGREGLSAGSERFSAGLRAFAARHGVSGLYHETITRGWIHLVWVALGASRNGGGFDDFVARHPQLLDKERLRAFYSAERLASEEARRSFLVPDLAPLPGLELAPDTSCPRDAV
jgi:hypothetical protein